MHELTRAEYERVQPSGCTVERVDPRLIERPGLTVPSHVRHWVDNKWGSTDRFLRHGFGLATVSATEFVSWSIGDCVNAGGCEIGIHTVPAQWPRGLAAVTAAAAVGHSLTASGWSPGTVRTTSLARSERQGESASSESATTAPTTRSWNTGTVVVHGHGLGCGPLEQRSYRNLCPMRPSTPSSSTTAAC